MVDREEKRLIKDKKAREVYDQWKDAQASHWSHWRAWGSWFSWGSPVGLGLFFISLSLATAILVWVFKY